MTPSLIWVQQAWGLSANGVWDHEDVHLFAGSPAVWEAWQKLRVRGQEASQHGSPARMAVEGCSPLHRVLQQA